MSDRLKGSVVGHILYDGSCGFCSKWVHSLESTFSKRNFKIAALQDDWVAKRVQLACEDELYRDLLLLLADGTIHHGAAAYRFVMRRIWWTYPIYLLSILPVFRQVFDWAYRTFADNRHKISGTCKIGEHRRGDH